ncbi:MAG TPA: VWA domain-containing protein [Dehalococcoidia bacterium]|nr:VWA domain-containing protein [Dehalococcoidia bacterium]
MRFADPEFFALLALVPLAVWTLRTQRLRPPAAIRLPSIAALSQVPHRSTWRTRSLPYLPALRIVGLILIIFALARPQNVAADSSIPAEGIDIVLTIDVSRSMIQQQLGLGTRLDAARDVARDFLDRRGNDRVGVVAFQAESLVLSPLTLDLEAVDQLLALSLRNGLLREGTALGLALAESIDLLRASEAPSRAIVALTDGQDNIRTIRPVEAAAIARALDIRIYTIGIAQPDDSAVTVDELALRFVAEETEGVFFRASNLGDLENAYAQIDALEKSRVGAETFTRYNDLASWILIPGLILILLELVAQATWWRRMP